MNRFHRLFSSNKKFNNYDKWLLVRLAVEHLGELVNKWNFDKEIKDDFNRDVLPLYLKACNNQNEADIARLFDESFVFVRRIRNRLDELK